MVTRVLRVILTMAPTRGRPGSDLRTAVGDFVAHAERLLLYDEAGPPLNEIFILARQAGIGLVEMGQVYQAAVVELPKTIGATIILDAMVQLALATACEIIAYMTFTSRDDVVLTQRKMNAAFQANEEVAADDMAQATYQALVKLHASLMFFLVETARPLPRMLRYRFFEPLPSIVMAYKLYADAARADELRAENKNIHPAFMQLTGRALSN